MFPPSGSRGSLNARAYRPITGLLPSGVSRIVTSFLTAGTRLVIAGLLVNQSRV